MAEQVLVRITSEPLDACAALEFVSDPAAGAVVLFLGTVRDHSPAGEVLGLDYEAWEERAEAGMRALAEEILGRWPVRKLALLHRTGRLGVGDGSVIVCCSSPHRAGSFEAARHGIERIKQDAPIWKKERLVTGGTHWVMGS